MIPDLVGSASSAVRRRASTLARSPQRTHPRSRTEMAPPNPSTASALARVGSAAASIVTASS